MKEQIKKAMEKIAQGEDVFFVDTLGETYLLLDSPILVTTRRWATGESVLARSKVVKKEMIVLCGLITLKRFVPNPKRKGKRKLPL
jgi:hypothetical protein